MVEITPRFAPPPDLPRGRGDLEAPQFHLAMDESRLTGPTMGTHPNPTAGGNATFAGLPQSQFFYADANGAGSAGTAGGAPADGPKQVVQTDNQSGGKTVKLQDFKPPGWEDANGDRAACYRLACDGASKTTRAGESPTGGGGVILYEKTSQRIKTDKAASDVALEQIKRHIDAGRSVVAGVSEPAHSGVVDPKKQPVSDHFVAINGYETDADGKITRLYAKDNAVQNTAEIRFEVGADGSITKPKDTKRDDYIAMEYQLSEVRFHTGFEYAGDLRPTNDAGKGMVWPPLPPEPDPHPLKHHVTEKI
jgi:hypothetical protein